MDLTSVFISIITMTFMIIIGAIIEVKLKTNSKVKETIVFIIVNLAIPSLILNGFFKSEINDKTFSIFGIMVISSLLINNFGIGAGFLVAKLFKFKSSDARLVGVISGLGNSGFIGIALCASLFGPIGGVYASFYDVGTALTVFSVGIFLLQKQMSFSWKNLIKVINLPVIACFTGLFSILIEFKPPIIAMQLIQNLSGLASPLAMFYIGILIPNTLKVLKNNLYIKKTILPIIIRLIIIPTITILIVKLLPLQDILKEIIIILSAMPTILLVSVFFDRYGHDRNFGIMSVIYSTIGSLFTIPLIAYLTKIIL